MKITKLIMLFVIIVGTVSCSKDDDNGPEPYNLDRTNFVDTYSLNSLEIKEVETITFTNGTTSTSTSTTVGSVFTGVNYIFRADGTFAASGLYNTVETIINPDGSVETKDTKIVSLDKTGTYTLNPTSKVLVLKDQDDLQTVFEITDYSPTAMKMYSETEVTTGNSTVVTTQKLGFTR